MAVLQKTTINGDLIITGSITIDETTFSKDDMINALYYIPFKINDNDYEYYSLKTNNNGLFIMKK